MKHPMFCWLLVASLAAALNAQDSRPHKGHGKNLLQRLNKDQDRHSGRRSRRGLDELRDQFRDLEQMMERMKDQFDDLGDLESSSAGTSISTGPDGVRVEIRHRRGDDGGETKVYEAPDMKTFKDKYPEIAKRFFTGGGRGVFSFETPLRRLGKDDPWFGSLKHQTSPRGAFRVKPLQAQEPAEGERLGVYTKKLAPEVRDFLDLDPGQGILVQEVTEDSQAQALGIEAGDVVCEINGTRIFSTRDVAQALRAIDKGDLVRVKVNRKGRDLELEAKKLVAAEKAELKKLEQKNQGVIR